MSIRLHISFLLLLLFTSHKSTAQTKTNDLSNSNSACFISAFTDKTNKIILTLPDSILDRDILISTRIINPGIFPVDELRQRSPGSKINSETMIRFQLESSDTILIKQLSYKTAEGTPSLKLIKLNILNRLNNTFHIDVSNLFKTNTETFYFNDYFPDWLGNFFYADSIQIIEDSFKSLSVISSRKYSLLTLKLNCSFILLRKDQMDLLPYSECLNETKFTTFSFDQIRQEDQVALKWNLVPSNINKLPIDSPANPIIFYIDKNTPKEYVPFFIKGVENWQKALKEAGFKNAIKAQLIKTSDSLLENFEYNGYTSIIHYVPSTLEDGSYSHTIDPRTGEILQCHIFFSTESIKLLHDYYFVQCSAIDYKARSMQYDSSVIGPLITNIISHEVGHALGFQHNMIANNSVSVKQLRNGNWLKNHNITSSIMDYARCNYIAQPKDKFIKTDYLINKIGSFDKWAIKLIYTYFSDHTAKSTFITQEINKSILSESLNSLPTIDEDPRTKEELLGNNNIKSSKYGISNLIFICNNMSNWISINDSNKIAIKQIFSKITLQYNIYISHVIANIGGFYHYSTKSGSVERKRVPWSLQKRSIKFIDKYLFNMPLKIDNKPYSSYLHLSESVLKYDLFSNCLQSLFYPSVIKNLISQNELPDTEGKLRSFLKIMHKIALTDLHANYKERPIPENNLSLIYITNLLLFRRDVYNNYAKNYSDFQREIIVNILNEELYFIKKRLIKFSKPENKDSATIIKNLITRINSPI